MAGLAAAIAVANRGARTLLVERQAALGGNATTGLLGSICGLYLTERDGGPRLANEGVPATVAARLAPLPGCGPPVRQGRTFVLPYNPPALTWLADRLVEEAGATLLLHTRFLGARIEGRRVTALHLLGRDGPLEVEARAVVDATGDGELIAAAGAVGEEPRHRQLPALVFVMQGVDTEVLRSHGSVAVLRAVADAEAKGRLPQGVSALAMRATRHAGEVLVQVNLVGLSTAPGGDPTTEAEVEGRRRVHELAGFLVTDVAAFRGAFLSHVAPQVAWREARTLDGRYRLTREDVLASRRFDDVAARGAWPIELWEPQRLGASYEYFEDGATYDIPHRALRAATVENLWAAGRCLSATHEALGSARVLGTALATGEAAGAAAAAEGER